MPETTFRASNALYRGECNGFEEACDLAVQAAREEGAAYRRQVTGSRRRPLTAMEWAEDADYLRSLDDYAIKARRAAGIYREVVAGVTSTAVARLRADGLDEFADALESADWSKLAI